MFLARKDQYRTFKEITFADKMDHPPLQAADMIAYRSRQKSENWVDGEERWWEAVDSVLLKPLHPYIDSHEKEWMQAYYSGAMDYPRGIKPEKKPGLVAS